MTDTLATEPTEHLYLNNAYLLSATATVQSVQGGDTVVLDRTIFYAPGGGQATDRGWIDGIEVGELRRAGGRPQPLPTGLNAMVDATTVHVLSRPVNWSPGQQVQLKLDWERRYRNMVMHSLAHYLFHASQVYFEKNGMPFSTRGAQIDDTEARFDFAGAIPAGDVAGIEVHVRDLVAGAAATVTETSADGVRIWRSGDIAIPCGGTHVQDAREIQGEIRLRRRSKGAGLTRLYVSLESDSSEPN